MEFSTGLINESPALPYGALSTVLGGKPVLVKKFYYYLMMPSLLSTLSLSSNIGMVFRFIICILMVYSP